MRELENPITVLLSSVKKWKKNCKVPSNQWLKESLTLLKLLWARYHKGHVAHTAEGYYSYATRRSQKTIELLTALTQGLTPTQKIMTNRILIEQLIVALIAGSILKVSCADADLS